jgi:hypothetical protein
MGVPAKHGLVTKNGLLFSDSANSVDDCQTGRIAESLIDDRSRQ